LDYTNQLLDYSTKVQTVWMYLEPVMTSPDILKHLSVEGSKFRVVDEMWKEVTSTFSKLVFVKEIIKNKKIVPSLKQCHANLEVVQKGLNSYLESKRLNFPRFFFLSNE
jgi:dynein heavy chain